MKIKILHLYYDFMNLYGEYGNIRLLTRELEKSGASVTVVEKTVTDTEIDFTDFDFIYCGAGTERNRTFALNHLKLFTHSLTEAYNSNKVMLFTGNSWEMLGKSIVTTDGTTVNGIGLFDFKVKEQKAKRLTGDVKATASFLSEPIIGFINKCSSVDGVTSPLFSLTFKPESFNFTTEGIHEKNFFGTQLVGPVLVKNPELCRHIARLINKSTD